MTASGRMYSTDGNIMFALTRAIVDDGTIVTDKYIPTYHYSKYGPLQSVAAIPLYVAAKPVTHILKNIIPPKEAGKWPMGFFNVFVTTISVLVMAAAAAELGVSARGAVATALLWGFATMAWPYSKFDFSAPLMTLCLMVSLLYSYRSIRTGTLLSAALAGLFFGLSVLTKYSNAALGPVFLLLAAAGQRKGRFRRIAAFCAPVVFSVIIIMYYNYVRFGDVTETGYHISSVMDTYASTPDTWWECIYGIFIGTEKNIFIYSPPALLALAGLGYFLKRSRITALCIALTIVINIALLSHFSFWAGGLAWGPRYFLHITAFCVWMAAPFIDKAVTGTGNKWRLGLVISLALAGILINIIAISIRFNISYENSRIDECIHARVLARRGEEAPDLTELPCGNPIVAEWIVLKNRAPKMFALALRTLSGDTSESERKTKYKHTYIDFWAVYMLPKLPPWPARLLIAFIMIGVAATSVCFSALIKSARFDDNKTVQ